MFQPFRFLHASDLNLDQPCQVRDESAETRSIYLQAPLVAAERVFETARLERADFVVLSGDIIHPRLAGAREFAFLLNEFQQLADQDIAVYWAGGNRDRYERWPEHWQWPDNVHFFSHRRVEEVSHFRDDEPLCTLIGISSTGEQVLRPADFRHSGTDAAIAVAYGESEPESFAQPGITYWALGGRLVRETVLKSQQHAHYAGTPQARGAKELGPRGCTIVHVTSPQQVRTQFIPTDRIRWVEEAVALGRASSEDEIALLLMDRVQRFQTESSVRTLNIHWRLKSNQITDVVRQTEIARDCELNLRESFPQVHTASWTWESENSIPSDWYAEESILGDFLRSIKEFEQSKDRLPLAEELTESQRVGGLGDVLALATQREQRELLERCAQLGSSLLRSTGDANQS